MRVTRLQLVLLKVITAAVVSDLFHTVQEVVVELGVLVLPEMLALVAQVAPGQLVAYQEVLSPTL